MKRIGAILTAFSLFLSGMTAFAETVPAEEADRAATLTAPLSEEETAQITMQDLQALNGLGLTVYEEEGRVTFVGGSCSTDPVKNPEDAERVISSMLTLMGGNERTRFEPWRVLTDTRGNRYYVFQQVSGDILVQGGAVKVITDPKGKMIGLTASLVDVPEEAEENEKPAEITAEAAEAAVLAHGKEDGREMTLVEGQTMKIVLPVNRELDLEADTLDSRYVWAVFTTNPLAGMDGVNLPYLAHYVTMNGEYLYSLPTIIPGDTAGYAGYDASYVFEFMEPVEYTGYVDYSDGSEREITVTLMRDTRTGMYYLGNIEHGIVVADCWEFLYNHGRVVIEYSPDNMEWDQTGLLSLWQYCKAWDYYNAIGWKGGDGEGTPIIVLKDFCDEDHKPVNNAAYAGKFYGWQTFLSSSVNDYAQCLDVAAHEFTHCVTQALMTHNDYMNDYGAINEAISDIHGNLCEKLAGDSEDTSWMLGEDGENPVRSMSEPNQYAQPDYVWDIYYREKVKEPTITNDYGGVHSNSSLLSHVAYLLCTEGGMTPEEARAYWFAVDCAMVPGSDYPQLKVLLPWMLTVSGLDSYQEALNAAISATRLGVSGVPDVIDGDRALLTLNLPDTEVFNNGKWALNVFCVNLGNLGNVIVRLVEDLSSGNLEGYPELIRTLAESANQEQTQTQEENKQSFLEILLEVITEKAKDESEPEPEPDHTDAVISEFRNWLKEELKNVFYTDMGSAGQDGHRIEMMSIPGWTIPTLMYLSVNSEGTVIEQLKTVLFINGRWVDISGLMNPSGLSEGLTNLSEVGSILLENDFVAELLKTLESGRGLEGILDAVTLDVKGGERYEIPNDGLEKIDLTEGIRDIPAIYSKEPNNRKSRPKIAEESR